MISKAIHACQGSNKYGIQHAKQNMSHQNKTKHHKHPYDHYAKDMSIRSIVYMIAKT